MHGNAPPCPRVFFGERDPLLDEIIARMTHVLGYTPHEWQGDVSQFLWSQPKSGCFADVGMGKALMSLLVLCRALMDLDSGPALVIAPIRVVKQTWPTEIAEWSGFNWIDHTLVRAEDGDPDVKAVFDRYRIRFHEVAKALGVPPAVRGKLATSFALPFRDAFKKEQRRVRANSCNPLHLIGIEQLEWLVEHHGRNWPYRTVVIDESSKFKDYSTNRFKAMNSVYKKVERMHLLTASPAPETYMDLFAQMYLLDRGERLGRRITHYRQDHFNHDEYTRSYELKAGHDTKISEKISDICLVMKAEDYLPLDKPNMLTRHIELDDDIMALYDQFVETFVLSLPENEIEALNGGSLINKLLQFTGGAVYDENKEVHEVHDDKLDDLRQLIDEIDTPIMVGYWYKSSLPRLRKAFPQAIVMDKAGKCVDAWNRNEIPLLLIHPASAGHGLNMQKGKGHDLVYFDIPWSRELYEQLIGRLARQGQKKVVRVWHLVVRRRQTGAKLTKRQAEDAMTADEIVMQALADKGAGQDRLFRLIRDIRARAKVVKPDIDSEDDL